MDVINSYLTQIPVNELSFLENLFTWGRTLASWYVDNLDSSSTVLQKMYTTVSMFSIPGKNYNDAGNNISRLGEASFYCRFVAVLAPWRRQPVQLSGCRFSSRHGIFITELFNKNQARTSSLRLSYTCKPQLYLLWLSEPIITYNGPDVF